MSYNSRGGQGGNRHPAPPRGRMGMPANENEPHWCNGCHSIKEASDFSRTQLSEKPSQRRRCKDCVKAENDGLRTTLEAPSIPVRFFYQTFNSNESDQSTVSNLFLIMPRKNSLAHPQRNLAIVLVHKEVAQQTSDAPSISRPVTLIRSQIVGSIY